MGAPVSYRHNVMTIHSIDTFVNIKGGVHNGQRDVYFVRALGEFPGLGKKLCEIDRKMNAEAAKKRVLYLRPSGLPMPVSAEDTQFYAKAYETWTAGGKVALRTSIQNADLNQMISSATREAIRWYKTVKPHATDTIIKNYAVKLWFWADTLLKDVLNQWTESICVKIIAHNIQKEQEYLFYYMVTLLGCDVLILNNRADINAGGGLRDLSSVLKLGEFGQSEIPGYCPAANSRSENVRNEKPSPDHAGKKLLIPAHPGRAFPKQAPPSAAASVRAENNRREKSFEELASLASSIVMIAVLDSNGATIATGSGIMIGRNGFILTNHHVVRRGPYFAVRIEDDEQSYTTDEVVKYNSQLDMSVIRIQRDLKPLPIYDGREKLVRGQKVVAIGSPLGLFNSVSDGIISGFRRINDVDMIQFTAPISHGSSGGAVLNMFGEVIGISTAGFDDGQNINLAVGYDDIKMFAKGFY